MDKEQTHSSACICQSTVCLCVVYVGHFSLFAMVLIGDFTLIFNIFFNPHFLFYDAGL